jgi:predicted Zn-dependent protease
VFFLFNFVSLFASLATVILLLSPVSALAQGQPRVLMIRDAEIENTIRQFAAPVFEAAGLDPMGVKIHIVNDKSLNAFVAGGQQLFINAGLLMRADHAGQVIGVIAHETGHISGGHLARLNDALGDMSTQSIAALIVGAAAAVATGRPDVGFAVGAMGSDASMRGLLAFTRGQESAADQAGATFLDNTGQSAKGMLEFMEILSGQDLLVSARQDPYVRTHPLTVERVSFLRNHVEKSPNSNKKASPAFEEMHRRMRAKLFAFIESPARTLSRYKESDQSIEGQLARAVAYYRKPDIENALPLINELIAKYPKDAYIHELKGQMLFEHGRGGEALLAYREAVKHNPAPLIQISLAQVELETNDDSLLASAQSRLIEALQVESANPFPWRLLAVAYGRADNQAMTSYAMAEHATLAGKLSEAQHHADRADKLLSPNSPYWLRVQDIKAALVRAREREKLRR